VRSGQRRRGLPQARFGVHEVINTIMMNYICLPPRRIRRQRPAPDKLASAPQTPRISPAADSGLSGAIPKRCRNPLNAFGVALIAAFITWFIMRWCRTPLPAKPNLR